MQDIVRLKPFDSSDDPFLHDVWNKQYLKLRALEVEDPPDARAYILNEVTVPLTKQQQQQLTKFQVPVDIVSSLKNVPTPPLQSDPLNARIDICWNKFEVNLHTHTEIVIHCRQIPPEGAYICNRDRNKGMLFSAIYIISLTSVQWNEQCITVPT